MRRTKSEITEAAESLQAILADVPEKHGKKAVHGIVRHVSSSGMSREISLLVETPDGLRDITYHASVLTGWSIGKHRGVRVAGCGMDMIFHLFDCVQAALGNGAISWQKTYRVEQL